jgi:hypothetical protein
MSGNGRTFSLKSEKALAQVSKAGGGGVPCVIQIRSYKGNVCPSATLSTFEKINIYIKLL